MRRLLVSGVVLLVLPGVGCGVEVGDLEFDPGSAPGSAAGERELGDPVEPPPAQDPDVEGQASSVGGVSDDLLAGFYVDDRFVVFVVRDATLAMEADGVPLALSATGLREGDNVRVWGQVRRREGGLPSVEANYVLVDGVE